MNPSGKAIAESIERECPDARKAMETAKARCGQGQLLDWQAMLLYKLAHKLDGGRMLEIGTFLGYSAAILSQAAPKAQITTLNPVVAEAKRARRNLATFANVTVVERASWDYLVVDGAQYDLIWVDGDHNNILRDLPWIDRLKVGGLMLFHDYSPVACPPVCQRVNALAMRHHGLDIQMLDDKSIGMAGMYRRAGEAWT